MNYVGNPPAPGGLILVGDTSPVGMVGWFHVPPDGSWLHLNGQSVSKVTFADLWAHAQNYLTSDQTANPGLYRSIDANTFALPKFDGLFIRSVGSRDANHVSDSVGAFQLDMFGTHSHAGSYATVGNAIGSGFTAPNGGGAFAANNQLFMTANGGSETRPSNVALVPCVKALKTVVMPATAMPATSGLVKLNSGVIAAPVATLDILMTGYTAYANKMLVLTDLKPATDGVSIALRFSSNGGASYDAGATDYGYAFRTLNSAAVAGDTAGATVHLPLSTNFIGNLATEGYGGIIHLLNTTKVMLARAQWQSTYFDTSGNLTTNQGSGTRAVAQDTDAVRVFFSAGNIASGDWALYGYA